MLRVVTYIEVRGEPIMLLEKEVLYEFMEGLDIGDMLEFIE